MTFHRNCKRLESRFVAANFARVVISVALFFVCLTVVQPSGVQARSLDAADFTRSLDVIQYVRATKNRKIAKISESSVVEYFQERPDALSMNLKQVVSELAARPSVVDTTKHVRLIPPQGQSGYEDLKFFVSHRYGERSADDLVKVWIDFLRQAEREIVINVFEFDLENVADELIAARKRNISVRVGVDGNYLKKKPENRPLIERLRTANVDVVEVDSSGLNHQKVSAIDWTDLKNARVLFSSGNLTTSCLDSRGDLARFYFSAETLAKNSRLPLERSVPNANHIITMKSWLAANLVHHELTKVFSKRLGFRGASFPTSGAYQITGPGVNPETLEAYPESSFIIAFTPGGGYRGVNRNILARLIKTVDGPIRMVQFAFSSPEIGQALLERAESDLQRDGQFDFQGLGETSFAMQGYSQFLKMSGLKRENVRNGKFSKRKSRSVRFLDDDSSPWLKTFGLHAAIEKKSSRKPSQDQFSRLRQNIRIAPRLYGSSRVFVEGRTIDVSAKIHHKLMSVGDFAVVGSSFNFSRSAESNNEQILVFHDSKIAGFVRDIHAELASESSHSVFDEAQARNERTWTKAASEPDKFDDEIDEKRVTD